MTEAPHIAAATVVAREQLAVDNHTTAKSGAEGHAEQIFILLGAACSLDGSIDFGQSAGKGFAIGKEVAVVVDIHRYIEVALQIRAESHAAAECREVGKVAYDAVLIVGRTGECKTDSHRRLGKEFFHLFKALYQG